MLVIIHAKFEVNSCCGWDFRQGGGKFTPPPPMHKRYLRHPMHNRVNVRNFRVHKFSQIGPLVKFFKFHGN